MIIDPHPISPAEPMPKDKQVETQAPHRARLTFAPRPRGRGMGCAWARRARPASAPVDTGASPEPADRGPGWAAIGVSRRRPWRRAARPVHPVPH
jgi:hypothetical protein